MRQRLMVLFLLMFIIFRLASQVEVRNRPANWSALIHGGRFMDRFLPMEGDTLSSHVWGAECVRPRLVDNGIECAEISFWGGNILDQKDGLHHLFVCGWKENSPRGHMTWGASDLYHAIGSTRHGPFHIVDTIGRGHNPEAFITKDGRIVIYVINGYYVSEKVNGPWVRGKFDFDARDRKILEGLSNLTFARRQDGSFLMVCRGGGVWVSQTGLTPYNQISDSSIYPAVRGRFEDPLIWRDSIQYHLIVNDWLGRIAYYQRSKDGLHWITEPGEAYIPGISFHEDGRVESWFKYERIKVFQDTQGRAVQMNFAVIDTLKKEDRPNDRHSSKNICIPVQKDMLLTVLNADSITSETKRIRVLIHSEEGFNPGEDLDISSLRFGSYLEVNYGRGGTVVSHQIKGRDLIVEFDTKECGITPDIFAPKMIGRKKNGSLALAYASLPYVDYMPPLLSCRKPVYNIESQEVTVCIENFGLKTSSQKRIELRQKETVLAVEDLLPLEPYSSNVKRFHVHGKHVDPAAPFEVVLR